MQDEVNEKTMALCIKGGKISAQLLKAALTKLLSEIEKKKQQSKKMGGQNRCKRGKQSIKSLQQSGAQLTNIVVTDNNIKSFDRVARKWNVDYAFYQTEPGKYLLFFKSGQAEQQLVKEKPPKENRAPAKSQDFVGRGETTERADFGHEMAEGAERSLVRRKEVSHDR